MNRGGMYNADDKMDELNDAMIDIEHSLHGFKATDGKGVDWREDTSGQSYRNDDNNNSGAKEYFDQNHFDQKGYK